METRSVDQPGHWGQFRARDALTDTPVALRSGDVLGFGRRVRGVRAYLAVAGGYVGAALMLSSLFLMETDWKSALSKLFKRPLPADEQTDKETLP